MVLAREVGARAGTRGAWLAASSDPLRLACAPGRSLLRCWVGARGHGGCWCTNDRRAPRPLLASLAGRSGTPARSATLSEEDRLAVRRALARARERTSLDRRRGGVPAISGARTGRRARRSRRSRWRLASRSDRAWPRF